ncbi:MAG: DNA mismatch repair protein MutS [Parvularculales bacterium]
MSGTPAPHQQESSSGITAVRSAGDDGATPMMAQYLDIKKNYPDSLLFYRMGDFYELFFDDARSAAEALDITLTRRGRYKGEDIPMCGVPVRAAETYLSRLIKRGFRVAICEQMEEPSARRSGGGGKTPVRRDVVRHVTPGTITEDNLLDARAHNYLAALAQTESQADECALSWLDMSTGDFYVRTTPVEEVSAGLARLMPGEVLASDSLFAHPVLGSVLKAQEAALTLLPDRQFSSIAGERRLLDYFNVKTLDSFGDYSRAQLAACGALLDYVATTQMGEMPVLNAPVHETAGSIMVIDAATCANLELTRTLEGQRRGSLLSVIDRTVTGAGSRLMADDLTAPLMEAALINNRLEAVGFLVEEEELRTALRGDLKACPDMARALSRLSLGRAGPRDLAALRDGIIQAHKAAARLNAITPKTLDQFSSPLLGDIALAIGHHAAGLEDHLTRALGAPDAQGRAGYELPPTSREGGFIVEGYDAALDELRTLKDESRRIMASLQERYAEETGIRTLKIRHHKALGYHLDAPSSQADKLMAPPFSESFIHRQTLTNVVRFTTTELSTLAQRIEEAAGQALELEHELFKALAEEALVLRDNIMSMSSAMARLDVVTSHAQLASEQRYCRPVVDESRAFRIINGRHPVVEAALVREGANFVANDCRLDCTAEEVGRQTMTPARRLWLMTGPNMAGKSTFLRQNALITILAQMGSFVPADEARIGVVDRLFSRVGAADDLAQGRSTFMVEMIETAAILHRAGERSLVILDEIGRGTATFDGLSIAWAVLEHLHDVNRCRGLFATHFHELTVLSARLDNLANATIRVKEWEGEVVFMHKVEAGSADRSYGIQVARLAGLPEAVLTRARDVLTWLESNSTPAKTDGPSDLPLFAGTQTGAKNTSDPLHERLKEIHPDTLTPKDALELIYDLKKLHTSLSDD